MRRAVAAILAACVCGIAFAQMRGPDTEARKTVNGFGGAIMLTKKPEEFVREWTTTPEAQKLSIRTSSEVRTGEYIAALVFFWGCRPERDSCRVYADFELVGPDGSARYNVPDKAGTTQSQPKADLVYLSQAIIRFKFEPNDAPGEYRIRATVREPATGNIVRVSEPFRFVK